MDINNGRTLESAVTAVFGLAVFAFFGFRYPYHLYYQETLQLFECTGAFASATIGVPGGLADYVAQFLTQFFYYPLLGAFIVALLLVGVQLTSWRLSLRRNLISYPLSLLPAIAVWVAMCDENGMFTVPVAVLSAQLVSMGLIRLRSRSLRLGLTCLSVPVLYMLLGSLAVITPLLVVMHEWERRGALWRYAAFVVSLCLIGALTVFAAHHIFSYSMAHLLRGTQYYRFVNVAPTMAWIATFVAAVTPLLSLLVKSDSTWVNARPHKSGKAVKGQARTMAHQGLYACIALTAVIAVAGYVVIDRSCDYSKEEYFEYDYLANTAQWQRIIDKADAKAPNSPYTVACLNLALAMSGQMGDGMFRYIQNGTEGLYPAFIIDFNAPLPTSEVFYRLGLINVAQRYVYEAQEAIPNYRKSSRCCRRLAEISLILGNHEAARKYLKTLSGTLLHSGWAVERMILVGDDEALAEHPEYGRLRALSNRTDALVSDDVPFMLVSLLEDNDSNKMAFDYLMASCQLNRDLEGFYDYLSSCTFPKGYVPPRSYQETLALMWVISNPSWEGIPWNLAPDIRRRMESYLRDRQAKRPDDYMCQAYGDTYWHYYFKQ